jgi:hypothetical protein
MATVAPGSPAYGGESLGSDLAGMGSFFMDPQGAARRVNSKWFWVAPLLIFSAVSIAAGMLMMPMVRHVMEVAPLPDGVTPEQYQANMNTGLKIQGIAMWFAPVITAVIYAIQAAVLLGMSTVMNIGAKFRQLFNLVAGCGLIQMLGALASLVILKSKGEVSSMAELRPALGFDIFLPEGTNKYLMSLAGYFSVFEIWWIVMIVLIFAAAYRVTKGKAFTAVVPLIVLNLLLRMIGAVFQR